MIVEFVGSTGAGKTTLAAEVERRLAAKVPVRSSFDFMAGLIGLPRAANPTIRNLVQDVVGFPFFAVSLYRNRAFVGFAWRTLLRNVRQRTLIPNYLRSVARKLGVHESIKRHNGEDSILLVDEGTLLSSYLLFVYTKGDYSERDIERFVSLVPLPDLVVYVTAPVGSLVRRALERTDGRRELKSRSETAIASDIERAVRMFDTLVETREVRDRVLVVSNPPGTDSERGAVADRIVDFILRGEGSMKQLSCCSSSTG